MGATDPSSTGPESRRVRLPEFLHQANGVTVPASSGRRVIGVLEGTGVGPEVIGAALRVLDAVAGAAGCALEIRHGGLIGEAALARHGEWLPRDVAAFCAGVFAEGGAILSGPGGGRYVYDLRRTFDLFCKFVPVQPWPALARAGRLRSSSLRDVDCLIVRDNLGGVYQGSWRERATPDGRTFEHTFAYAEAGVRRLIEVAARTAAARRGRLCVILKEGGVPGISALWREVGVATGAAQGVDTSFMNVDFAAYELIQNPARFDVIVAPNLFGDILADVAGVLLASRGVTFSGNYSAAGHAVYQTNHGCAHDLAGRDVANPAGQVLSVAMLLRESFGLFEAAALIEEALAACWRDGWRTADLAEPGCRVVGTRDMTERICDEVVRRRIGTDAVPPSPRHPLPDGPGAPAASSRPAPCVSAAQPGLPPPPPR